MVPVTYPRAYAALCLLATLAAPAALAEIALPQDAKPTCAVTAAEFDTWFIDGTAAAGNSVVPPNGFDFPDAAASTNCDFYKWGAQMFLWLASPRGDAAVFDSEGFFDVVHTDNTDKNADRFEMIPNHAGAPNRFALRSTKPQDRGGSGQAGGGDVLLTAKGGLTYYGIHVNDTYAAFVNGMAESAFNFTRGDITHSFPVTEADAAQVVEYGMQHGLITYDPDASLFASTVEMKTSWVDVSEVDPSRHLVITADVPKFDTGDAATWPADGIEKRRFALVGMHIAAPVKDHPELVWISYEHLDNAPLADYTYINDKGEVDWSGYDAKGSWIYAVNPSHVPNEIASVASIGSDGAITAANGATIGPVQAAQKNPWGNAPGPDSSPDSNTDLVSLNASIGALLAGLGDVRAQYYQLGGIWTAAGQLPYNGQDGTLRGGLRLANATMETFHQYPDYNNGFTSVNCFSCHGAFGAKTGTSVSHIFDGLAPLK